MTVETVFLDAGGVLLFPNWARVSQALERHGVGVSDAALSQADYRARRRLDVGDTIGATTDASRAWLYFDLVLTRSRRATVARHARRAAGTERLPS